MCEPATPLNGEEVSEVRVMANWLERAGWRRRGRGEVGRKVSESGRTMRGGRKGMVRGGRARSITSHAMRMM